MDEDTYANRRAEFLERQAREWAREAAGCRAAGAALRAQGVPDEEPELSTLAGFAASDEWQFPPELITDANSYWNTLGQLVRAGLLEVCFRPTLKGNGRQAESGFHWRKRQITVRGSHTAQEWADLKRQYDYCCLACGRREPDIELHKDHIVPRTHNGRNDINNLQPLCKSCNSRKGARTIDYRPQPNGVQT